MLLLYFKATVVASMIAEKVYPIKSTTSIKLILCLIPLAMLSRNRLTMPWKFYGFLGAVSLPYLAHAYLTGFNYSLVRQDLVSLASVMVLAPLLEYGTMKQAERDAFLKVLCRLVLILSLSGAIAGLVKMELLNRGIYIPMCFNEREEYPGGTALHTEYNVYSLGIFLGLCTIGWLKRREENPLISTFITLGIPVILIALLLTGSRRAVIYVLLWILIWGAHVSATLFKRRAVAVGPKTRSLVLRGTAGSWLVVLILIFFNWRIVSTSLQGLFTSDEGSRIQERASTMMGAEAIETRLPYWEYFMDRLGQMNATALLFGGGFGYIGEFGHLTGVDEDYPHNFWLSSMLYGGIIQVLLIFWFLALLYHRGLTNGSVGILFLYWLTAELLFLSISSNSFFSSEFVLVVTFFLFQSSVTKQTSLEMGKNATRHLSQH